jgi:hypothetical protein
VRGLPTVHYRQRQDPSRHGRQGFERTLQSLDTIRRLDDVEAAELEVFAVHLSSVGMVIDEQKTYPFDLCFHGLEMTEEPNQDDQRNGYAEEQQ